MATAKVNMSELRRHPKILGAATLLTVLAGAACSTKQAGLDSDQASRRQGASVSSDPTVASSNPAAAACSDTPPVTNSANGNGDAIELTLIKQSGRGGSWDVALPRQVMDRYPSLLAEGRFLGFEGLDAAIGEGHAFGYGGTRIALQARNRGSKHLAIYDIRPVNMRRVCLPSGLLVQYGTEGGDFVSLTFDLDAARPVAHERVESGEISTNRYFEDNPSIEVPVDEPLDISLDFNASAHAYSFDIGVYYVMDGSKFAQLVRGKSGPFLATASDCPNADARRSLSEADANRLRAHRYQEIRRRASDDGQGHYIVTAVAPDEYVRQCATW